MSQLVGLVLAGGSSRRLGRSKGELLFKGQSLAERAAHSLWPLSTSVLISIGRGTANPAPGFSTVEDLPPAGRGPLAGIDAGFRATGDADLAVLACDYPLVETQLMRQIVESKASEDDVVIVTDCGGRDHPLVALWRRRSAAVVAAALEKGLLRVRALLPDLAVKRIGPQQLPGVDLDRLMFNLNWPGELEELNAAQPTSPDGWLQAGKERHE
jgi:molybdopterin-guanine dinucleotide biosynthesis protein A